VSESDFRRVSSRMPWDFGLWAGFGSLRFTETSGAAKEEAVRALVVWAIEVIVQIPFIGPNPLQAVFGSMAVAIGALALRARQAGWRAAA
jgi:hypothetical protein